MDKKDFEFFENNMADLYKEYGHKFFAIKNQNIIGIYDTFENALNETLKTEELGTFLIQECFENKEEATQNFQGNFAFYK
jgi:hypothetical protein